MASTPVKKALVKAAAHLTVSINQMTIGRKVTKEYVADGGLIDTTRDTIKQEQTLLGEIQVALELESDA